MAAFELLIVSIAVFLPTLPIPASLPELFARVFFEPDFDETLFLAATALTRVSELYFLRVLYSLETPLLSISDPN